MGSIGEISPSGSIAIGIIVGLLSTSVQSLGLTLQRKSHILEDEKGPLDVQRPAHRRRRWQIGMSMFVIANLLGSSVQISTLPLPVLSTLQASGLVFNSICASLLLAEPFTRWSLSGTLLVFTGAVLIAVFGAIPAPAHTLEELLVLLGRPSFVIWMSFQIVIVISMAVVTDFVSCSSAFSQHPKFRLMRGLSYGAISGILSAHTLLVAKSAVELLITTVLERNNQFVHWQAWADVVLLIALALTQLYYLHRGLKLVSTSVLYPLVFCIYNILAILDGLIYFHQTHLIHPWRACLIALGTVILLSGVLALSWRLNDEQQAPVTRHVSNASAVAILGDDTDDEAYDDDEDDSSVAAFSLLLSPQDRPHPSRLATTPNAHLHERMEIWDELHDRRNRRSASAILRRSMSCSDSVRTLPLRPRSRRRTEISGATALCASAPALESATGPVDLAVRRRISTGFLAFLSRKSGRRRGWTHQGISGSGWRYGWWPGRRGYWRSTVEAAPADQDSDNTHIPDPEEGASSIREQT